ncbi:MAG: Type 1 glutamine amidotransferase-like domain-containing protein [Microgenomates group bacterium]
MKRLFLASQFYVSGANIGAKIPDEAKKNTVFITTSIKYRVFKESELDWHYKNRATLKESGFICEDYDITGKSEQDLKNDLDKYQVIYMEGGNTAYLLQQAQKNNFGKYITTRVNNGMIYVSESAGSVIAGPDIYANGRPGKSSADYGLTDTHGFGLVNFEIMPHWGKENKKADYMTYKIPQAYNEDFPYILLANTQYVEVTDDWYKIIDITKEGQK